MKQRRDAAVRWSAWLGINTEMKTDKQLADELDAQDRLRNRGYRKEQCSLCKGLGHVTSRGDTGVMQRPCFKCEGRGFKWVAPFMRMMPNDSSSATARITMDSKLQQEREVNGGTPFAEARGYAAWRAKAEKRLSHLVAVEHEMMWKLQQVQEEKSDLQEIMGNGASGGTAWMRHND